ncbi:phosphate/phosphite/phosphonate ABC transporter substrate-binding protein [Tindallia californiensis]|uniref:Phosphonate transport system substrate-binding protein n=1 Tax=Tindallia californiensis TaxID=159292 RepID=A0A1H3LPQ3_9FIRM|nr:phosphate/phosphite/phosphonate ABC transporter substrate-binding protein [Tindallia californiensis]SDY66343.1 phosphonate transport system substrate-binding protein [Tindallia californiensis]
MKKIIAIGLLIALLIALPACGNEEEEVITMGFVPMRDGDALIESVEPLTAMLSEELGVTVKGFTATNYVGVVEGLGSGQVDFGFIPPLAYVLANQESDAEVILTSLNRSGEAFYKSQFLVREDSEIEDFQDIKGKIVAFVDPSSTSGYLFPGAFLVTEGIDLERDIQYSYSGGHDQSLQLLLNGDVDVAATFVDARERYSQDFPEAMDKSRILGYTDKIPNISVTVSGSMEAKRSEEIQQALLRIAEKEEGKELLQELFNMHGFAMATDADYQVIRDTAEIMNIDLRAGN